MAWIAAIAGRNHGAPTPVCEALLLAANPFDTISF
jgi:hypothetical protein